MRDLTAAEHDRDLDLVLGAQEALDMALLGGVVVRRDLRAELDLPHVDLLLVLLGLLGLLRLLVLVLRVVEDAADGRLGLGRDLDEVELLALRDAQRLVGVHDAELAAGFIDQTHLRDTDPVVDPGRVLHGHAPVESSGDRH